MANAFSLYGELKADTKAFEDSLLRANDLLDDTAHAISVVESQARLVGNTSATTARQFEKFNDAVQQQQKRVLDAADAFKKGDISAKQFAAVINQTDTKVSSLNSRIKDSSARLTDWANKSKSAGSVFASVFQGSLAANGITRVASAMKDFVTDGLQMYATLDRLTRFTSTLDKSFQTPQALEKFQEDIKNLSAEIPQSAESIAKASFAIKSAFQDMKEPDLVNFLREMGNAATASNVEISDHADRVVALAKAYKIPAEGLREFSAVLTTTFGNALARDEEVGKGFQSLISPALRAGQSFTQLAAAMGAMQSMSTDAALNTTYLRQVLVKLVDPKFAAGMHEIGVEVYNQSGQMRDLSDIVADLTDRLKGLTMEQKNALLAPIMKDQRKAGGWEILMQSLDKYKDGLNETAKSTEVLDAKTSVMTEGAAAKYQKLTNKLDNLKMSLGAGLIDAVENLQKLPPPKAWTSEEWRGVILKGLRMGATGAFADMMPITHQGGLEIGRNMDAGLILGLQGDQSGVISAAVAVALAAYNAAKDALWISSPSKKFFGLGKDTVQGFIDGIESLKASAQSSMASILDIGTLKGLKKTDAPGVELLSQLSDELARVNAETKTSQVLIDLSAGKYGKLNAAVRERILLAAHEIDRLAGVKDGVSQLNNIWDDYVTKLRPATTATEDLNNALSDPNVVEAMQAYTAEMRARIEAMLHLGAVMKDTADISIGSGRDLTNENGPGLGEGGDLPAPPPLETQSSWDVFFGRIHEGLGQMRKETDDFSGHMGDVMSGTLFQVGDVFGNAVRQWDGTLRGFFQSLASGFADMAKNIISELLRILVYKAILKLIGSFAGGGVGGGGGLDDTAIGNIPTLGGLAGGGLVRGPGTSTSDSILTRLSAGEFVMPAKAVKKFGVGMMESIRGMAMGGPAMMPAFAGSGGASPAAGNVYNYNFTFRANENGQFSKESMDQAQRRLARGIERTNMRGNES